MRGGVCKGYNLPCSPAQVAKLVDALASGASPRKGVKVRVLSWAPNPYKSLAVCRYSVPMTRPRRWLVRSLLPFSLVVLAGCGSKPLPVANHDTVVTLGSAATVKIFAFGDLEITFPSGVMLKRAAEDPNALYSEPLTLVEAEYRRDLSARTLPEGTTLQDYAWMMIGKDPSRYLVLTGETATTTETDVNYSTGSGFVATDDGYVVTCQHCVSGGALPGYLNQEIFDGFMGAIERTIGAQASQEVMSAAAQGIAGFLAQNVQTVSIFKEARVLVPQEPRDLEGYNALTKEDSPQSLTNMFRPTSAALIRKWTWTSDIVATGENWPGKDVAVLKIPAVKLLTIPVSQEAPPRPDSTVFCLGFPGKAVQQGTMTKEASFRVILHRGQVGQTLPTRSGFEAIHTDADINHGDSGGPALNDKGEVVGLSVSGQEDAPGQNYLVPASVILEKLNRANVVQKKDPLNEDWNKGLLLLQAKRFAEARDLFVKIQKAQDNDFVDGRPVKFLGRDVADFMPNTVNSFVVRALKDAEAGVKK